ncbi:hypothetical protein NKH77_33080 [Streptomyces sp. M19]
MLRGGADDCVPETSDPDELSARIEAKLRRVPVPVENLLLDPRTGLYSSPHFLAELDRELQRPDRRDGVMAMIAVAETEALEARLGPRVHREVVERLAAVAERLGGACDRLGWDDDGHLLMLLPGVGEETRAAPSRSSPTPWRAPSSSSPTRTSASPCRGHDPPSLRDRPRAGRRQGPRRGGRGVAPPGPAPGGVRAVDARHPHHAARRSLVGLVRPLLAAISPLLVLLLGVGVPFLLYQQAYHLGWDIGSGMYWVVVTGLLISAALIVLECLFSLDAVARPEEPARPYPRPAR